MIFLFFGAKDHEKKHNRTWQWASLDSPRHVIENMGPVFQPHFHIFHFPFHVVLESKLFIYNTVENGHLYDPDSRLLNLVALLFLPIPWAFDVWSIYFQISEWHHIVRQQFCSWKCVCVSTQWQWICCPNKHLLLRHFVQNVVFKRLFVVCCHRVNQSQFVWKKWSPNESHLSNDWMTQTICRDHDRIIYTRPWGPRFDRGHDTRATSDQMFFCFYMFLLCREFRSFPDHRQIRTC